MDNTFFQMFIPLFNWLLFPLYVKRSQKIFHKSRCAVKTDDIQIWVDVSAQATKNKEYFKRLALKGLPFDDGKALTGRDVRFIEGGEGGAPWRDAENSETRTFQVRAKNPMEALEKYFAKKDLVVHASLLDLKSKRYGVVGRDCAVNTLAGGGVGIRELESNLFQVSNRKSSSWTKKSYFRTRLQSKIIFTSRITEGERKDGKKTFEFRVVSIKILTSIGVKNGDNHYQVLVGLSPTLTEKQQEKERRKLCSALIRLAIWA